MDVGRKHDSGETAVAEGASQVALVVKNLPAKAGQVREVGSIPGCKDPLREEVATHPYIPAWRVPWTEEPGGLQSIGVAQSWM